MHSTDTAESILSAQPASSQRRYEPLSWRDPHGFVINADGRIFRAVALPQAEQVRSLLRTQWLKRFIDDGRFPATAEAAVPPRLMEGMDGWMWLEHELQPFPCYPHEITALQLYDSAQLTLEIAIAAALDGWTLKDASAWNVIHSRGRPVFIDLLSFERRGCLPLWVGYGQFVRHFILPLMLYRHLRIPPAEIFLAHRDGIAPERAYEMLSGMRLFSATALEFVLAPKWLARAGGRLIESQTNRAPSPAASKLRNDLLLNTLRGLQRSLRKLQPGNAKSPWRDYEEERSHYTEADIAAKAAFVSQHLQDAVTVLDLGCNAGEFSLLAARNNKVVVAADADHGALSRLYSRIRGKDSRITPVAVNIGRPTPAVGWQNKEVAAFMDRAAGHFDCILMLGLLHHLLVSERASLRMIAELLERLAPRRIVLEWIDPTDAKFRQLAGANAELYAHLKPADLEDCMRQKFRLSVKLPLPCATRVLYVWTK